MSRPQRIISLVPSITETLVDLGLRDRIVGVTKFCIHPEDLRKETTVIGGTKTLTLDVIAELSPDLIIANKEENVKEQVEWLQERFPVVLTDVVSMEDTLRMINQLGEACDASENANRIAEELLEAREASRPISTTRKVLYLIWKNPWMCAGRDTYIDQMLQEVGWTNAITEVRYPELDLEEMRALEADLVLLSSEPFPFKEEHLEELRSLMPNARIELVDGEMCSWFGSRTARGLRYLTELESAFSAS